MRSNRGITLSTLVLYVAGLLIIITLMATFTGYFYSNLDEITISQNAEEEYSNFLAYITNDINSDDLIYLKAGVNGEDCVILKFSNGEEHQYIYQNNKLYYVNVDSENEKKITLCTNVTSDARGIFIYSDGILEFYLFINEKAYSNSLVVNL